MSVLANLRKRDFLCDSAISLESRCRNRTIATPSMKTTSPTTREMTACSVIRSTRSTRPPTQNARCGSRPPAGALRQKIGMPSGSYVPSVVERVSIERHAPSKPVAEASCVAPQLLGRPVGLVYARSSCHDKGERTSLIGVHRDRAEAALAHLTMIARCSADRQICRPTR